MTSAGSEAAAAVRTGAGLAQRKRAELLGLLRPFFGQAGAVAAGVVYGSCTELRGRFEAQGQAYVLRLPSNFMITLAAGTKSSGAPTKQADTSAHNIRFDIIRTTRGLTITHAHRLSARYLAATDDTALRMDG